MAKQSTSSNGRKKAATKVDWAARSDRGPHHATLPSGMEVDFIVPDSNALIRSGRLPDKLAEIAIMAAAYPDGSDAYMNDLAVRAVQDPEEMPKLTKAVKEGLDLRDWLVAHMLVEPELDVDDVVTLPESDVMMLVEFAERKRDTDAAGVRLPIVMLEVFARFRDIAARAEADAAGEGVGVGVPAADAAANGSAV